MADTYSNTFSRMSDTFGSIISNNMNGVMKKLTVVKVGEAAGPYGDRRSLDVEVQYPGNDAESFTMDGYFAIYAMGASGEVHQLKREELLEIEML